MNNNEVGLINPNFKNPVLKEAICEFHFSYKEGEKWDSSYAMALYENIKDRYPKLEPGSDRSIEFEIKDGAIIPKILSPRQRFKYMDVENNNFIVLTENTYALTVRTNYDWEEFNKILISIWNEIRSCVKPNQLNRIGLRFINHIILEQNDFPSSWLQSGQYLPATLLSNNEKFSFRSELQNGQISTIISLGLVLLGEEAMKNIIFDIDKIFRGNLDINDNSSQGILKIVNNLHDEVRQVFYGSITKKLRDKMSEGVL